MCALGGRPREEGGHKRIDISLDKETRRKLEKFKKRGGNVSQFIEREIKPVLEKLDPGEQAIHIYRIEAYLSKQILEAVNKGDFETVKILGSVAKAIDDYRRFTGIPPLDYPIIDSFSKQAYISEEQIMICLLKALVDSLPEGKVKAHLQETLIHDIETLYPKLSLEQILASWELELEALSKQDNFALAFIRSFKEHMRKVK